MYIVCGQTFATFEEVSSWAWDTYKILWEGSDELTEEQKQQECRELEDQIKELEL